MTVHDLIEQLPASLLCGDATKDISVEGGYACDMLSWVISKIEQTDVWLTIQNSANVIAVAALSECACVLLTEDVDMAPEVLERAREKSIVVLTTSLTTWQASARLANLLGTI